MNGNKTIIFDFDGTIANTLDAAIKIYNRLAHQYRCEQVKLEDLPNLRARKAQEFLKDYGVSHIKLPIILLHIQKELRKEIALIDPIEGVIDALFQIKEAGYNLGIMTSNSKSNVSAFLKANKIDHLFDFIYSGKHIFGKDKVIKRLLRKQNIPHNQAIYVGDETRDVEAAKKIKLPVIAVSWGFNSHCILSSLEPNHVIHCPTKMLWHAEDIFKESLV